MPTVMVNAMPVINWCGECIMDEFAE
jgi:hypothetical protein